MATKSIGIDIREAHAQGAGKGRYTQEITKALIQQAPKGTEFMLFTRQANETFPNSKRVKQIVIPGNAITWHFNLRRYLKKAPVDFFLSPTSFIYPVLAPKNQKLAIVVHDLIAFLHPENHHWFPILVERLSLKHALKKSQFIVSVSKNTAKDLKQIRPEAKAKKIVLAPPAVNPSIHKTSKKTRKLPERFVLAVGTLQPRKNFKSIFTAFEKVAKTDSTLHLCIAGGKGWKTAQIFKALPEDLKERIHFLGYVVEEQLTELYSRAQMLVFPSLYEGFGIPPLEAMACECPVITSNTSSLPEVVADAAITIDPQDTDALAKAIQDLLGPRLSQSYVKRGLLRVKAFSWKESAKAILEAI